MCPQWLFLRTEPTYSLAFVWCILLLLLIRWPATKEKKKTKTKLRTPFSGRRVLMFRSTIIFVWEQEMQWNWIINENGPLRKDIIQRDVFFIAWHNWWCHFIFLLVLLLNEVHFMRIVWWIECFHSTWSLIGFYKKCWLHLICDCIVALNVARPFEIVYNEMKLNSCNVTLILSDLCSG